MGYPPRKLYAFHTEKDLRQLIERRKRGPITDFKTKDYITDRDYQKTGIKAVCEHLNKMHRRALLVMATGTGKTRVAISLADVLMRNDWVKNVLFLADRTSLVRQAHKNFVKLLPNTTTCVLSENDNKEKDLNARIMFSTYQTMINYIDTDSKEIFTYIFNIDTIDKVLQDLMTNGLSVQGGERIGKTIIFAYNHQHAEMIVQRFNILYPEYGSGFCVFIDNYVNYAQDLIDKMEIRDADPQIAVSVDMLDTGIDIPDILNLVFFKIVKSKIKFWQMVGRGTRLSENIFGAGKDKEQFYIFDWCRNFEYFGKNPDGKEAPPAQSLTERLFCIRAELAFELQNQQHQAIPFDKQLHDDIKQLMLEQVQQLSDNHISVRECWESVSRMKNPENWIYLSLVDVEVLKQDISPLLAKSQTDEAAKRFDLLVLTVELSQVSKTVKATRSIKNIITIAQALSEKSVIPQIHAKMETINMVLSDVFWLNITLDGLEKIRIDLRELVKFIFGEKRKSFEVDIEDVVIDDGVAEDRVIYTTYRQRVLEYLAANRNLPVLKKILNIEPLTVSDIKELERILWEELGTKDDYRHCTENMICGDFVAAFIRSIIGVDRAVALKMFTQFISNNELNSQQEEYLKTIINYVCENGDIEVSTLINDSAFNDYDVVEVWGQDLQSVGQYIEKLHRAIIA
ncbi:MAG: DEAD/DEAH box helicase family protein [Bacteroidales bacterium]|nr:DEAD/DEAH box helicase family protein [Bacteroidales bacterium]